MTITRLKKEKRDFERKIRLKTNIMSGMGEIVFIYW